MGITTVTRNYQITLPKDVREIENIHIGDILNVAIKEDAIEIKKMPKNADIMGAFGAWKKFKGNSVAYVRNIRRESEKRLKRLGL